MATFADRDAAEHALLVPDLSQKTATTEQGSFAFTGTAGVSGSGSTPLAGGKYLVWLTENAWVSYHASTAASATNSNPLPKLTWIETHIPASVYLRAIRVDTNGTCYYFKTGE